MANVERRLQLWLRYLISKISLLVAFTLRGNEYTSYEGLFERSSDSKEKLTLFSIERRSWFPRMNGQLSRTLHDRQSQEILKYSAQLFFQRSPGKMKPLH